jgi:hypothetical protein
MRPPLFFSVCEIGCSDKRWRDRFGFFESLGPKEPAVSNLGFILVCLFLLLLLGGLVGGSVVPYWGYGYGLGLSGLGVLGVVLIVVFVLALTRHL